MEKTTLYLPAEMQRALREVARRERKSQAEVMREALATYLKRYEKAEFSFIGIGEDDELTGRDSEAWLEGAWDRGER